MRSQGTAEDSRPGLNTWSTWHNEKGCGYAQKKRYDEHSTWRGQRRRADSRWGLGWRSWQRNLSTAEWWILKVKHYFCDAGISCVSVVSIQTLCVSGFQYYSAICKVWSPYEFCWTYMGSVARDGSLMMCWAFDVWCPFVYCTISFPEFINPNETNEYLLIMDSSYPFRILNVQHAKYKQFGIYSIYSF